MADPSGVLSGFVGVCIDITVHGIIDQINIAVRCKKELNSLRDLVKRIEPIISQIQQYRLALNREKGIPNKASAVNQWLQKMGMLLKQGLAMAQMCFLYLAAFLEDEMVSVDYKAIPFWMGEGLLGGNKPEDQCGHDPLELGRIYVNVLAERCLIEPIYREVNGRVVEFRMHDVLRDLAIQIAEHEEKFYCRAGQGLTTLNENECSGRTRILLNNNNLTSLPQSWSAPNICSLTVRENNIIEIPRRLFGGMTSLKILDLNRTSLESLPESVGCLKQLVYLNLAYVPITRLPPSFTNLVNLQILILRRSRITKLPSDIHKLRSLKNLSLSSCADLQCLPRSISGLTSLQFLDMSYCTSMWTKQEGKHICKRVASLQDLDLGNLGQLKTLHLSDNGQTIREGTLGKFAHMESLLLNLETMTDLPHDMTNMSKLRKLSLYCPCLVKLGSNICEFRNLSHLRMWYCQKLEELPHLHKLPSLRHLDIVGCNNFMKFPKEYGENSAFPVLEIFSLVALPKLEELPIVEEGAMPSLQILTMMNCEKLEMMSKNYLNLKTLKKIRVYGCNTLLENLEKIEKPSIKVEMVATSTLDLEEFYKKWEDSHVKSYLYDEFWCNEVYLFLNQLHQL